MKRRIFDITLAAMLCVGAVALAEEEASPAEAPPEKAESPAASGEAEAEAASPDAASTPPKVLLNEEPLLRTRLVGRWQSEILLTERSRMQHLGGGRYGLRTDKVYPFYNTIELRAYELGFKGLSIHFRGWSGLDLADLYFDERFVADLTSLYLQYRDHGLDAKVGRQMVFEGAARGLQIDGANLSYETPLYLGVQVFGGLRVTPKRGPDWDRGEEANGIGDFASGFSNWDREGDFGDWAVGGRVFYRIPDAATAGISFLHTRTNTEIDQQVAGADLNLAWVSWFALSANALLFLPEAVIQESNVALDFFPSDRVSLGVDYRHADPTLYISRMSIFSVFSNEKYDAVGGDVRLFLGGWITIHAGYHQHIYRFIENSAEEGDSSSQYRAANELGYDFEGGVRLRNMDLFGIARFDFRRLKQDLNGINQISLAAAVPIAQTGLLASANVYVDIYDKSINGEKAGVLGDLGLHWKKAEWEVGGAVTAGVTPHARNEWRGIIKAAYHLDLSFVERRQP